MSFASTVNKWPAALAALVVGLSAATADAEVTNTWHFTNATRYAVSDPTLVQVNTNAPGYAELILQAQEIHHTTLAEWTNAASWSLVNFGPEVSLRLSGTPGSYQSVGTFTSRILDGGSGVVWDMLQFRASERAHSGDTNLVALYRMDNDAWLDTVSGNNATPFGVVGFSPSFRVGTHSGQLRGLVGDYVTTVGRPLNGKRACTMAFWRKIDTLTPFAGLVMARVGASELVGMAISSGTNVNFALTTSAGNAAVRSPDKSLPVGEWVFIVGTWDANGDGLARIYFNGILMAISATPRSVPIIQADNLKIGWDDWQLSWVSDGLIDELAIFDRALSSNEVAALHMNYAATFPVKLQVRSGTSIADVQTKSFVGPEGSSASSYGLDSEKLRDCQDFGVSNQYAQYRVQLNASSGGLKTPYVEEVGLIDRNSAVQRDSTLFNLAQGQFGANTTYMPDDELSSFLGLRVADNGGYSTNGTYTSRTLDAGGGASWLTIAWGLPKELASDIPGLVGLWHFNESWASAKNSYTFAQVAESFTPHAKLGTASARFNGATAHTQFTISRNLQTIEFWFRDDKADDSLMAVTHGGASTMNVVVTNRILVLSGTVPSGALFFVNGYSDVPQLLSGWNHVMITFPSAVFVNDIDLGLAAGRFMAGLVDEMAIYDRVVSRAEAKAHFVAGRRQVSGRVLAQVRYGDTLPLAGAFGGAGGAPGVYFSSGDPLGVASARYLQYRLCLDGDGSGTPAVNSITITHSSGTFVDDTRPEVGQGSYDSAKTAWYGEEIKRDEIGVLGPVSLNLSLDGQAMGVWHMDEDTWSGGGPVVKDGRGTRDGTPAGDADTSVGGKVGPRCGIFDGSGDYVSLLAYGIARDLTVSAWFNTTAGSQGVLVSTEGGTASHFTLAVNSDGSAAAPGRLAFRISDGGAAQTVIADREGLNDGRWHHAVAIREAGQIHLYVDGRRAGTANLPGGYGTVGNKVPYLAVRGTLFTDYYSGLMDEVAIWSRALTEAEIGQIDAAGFRTEGLGEYQSSVIDNTQPAIWQTLFWQPDAPYSKPLSAGDSSLIGLWRMEEAAGPITNSVGANNGTVTGAGARREGRHGYCFHFDGFGDYIDVAGPALLQPAQITVEAWVSMTDTVNRVVLDKRSGSGYDLGTDANGRPYFRIAGTQITGPLPVRAGKWTHLAGSYDSTKIRLYMDGDLVAVSEQFGLDTTTAGVNLLIGRNRTGLYEFYGRIDEVAIHNRALRDQELFDHYRAGAVTLKLQARSANNPAFPGVNFVGPGGLTNTYFTLFSGDDMVGDVPLGQYFQYRAFFATEDARLTPRLHGVKVFVSSYPVNNPTVEPVDSAGYAFPGRLLGFNHTRTFNPGTDVQYQISGDSGGGPRWFYWDGSAWTQESGLGYPFNTSTRDAVASNIVSLYSQLYDKVGGLLRFKAFLNSAGDQQVSVDKIDLAASPGRVVVTVPNGTENGSDAWISAVPYDIEWTWTGTVGANLVVEYTMTGQGATNWVTITNAAPRGVGGNGRLTWTIPRTTGSTNCFIRVRDPGDSSIEDMSDSPFTIARRFRLVAPDGGETWYLGRTNAIVWESSYDVASLVQLYFAQDGTNYGYRIVFATPNVNESKTNTYLWATPATNTALLSLGARVKVQKPSPDPATDDESDGTFIMAGAVVTAPTAGRKVKRNSPYTIEWESAAAGAAVAIELSRDGGLTYTNTVVASTPNQNGTNSYVWDVTSEGTDQAILRIRSLSDPNVVGYSFLFTLADIDITAPDGAEIWLMNTTNTITWTSGGAGGLVNIAFSTNSGVSWMTIADGVPNSGAHPWIVSTLVSKQGRVRVESVEDTNLWSVSAADFNIAGVRVTFPNLGSDTLQKGQSYFMTHDAAPASWSGAWLDMTVDQGSTYTPFDEFSTNWNLGDAFLFTPTYPSSRAKVRVTVNQSAPFVNVFDESDAFFTIAGLLAQAPTTGSVYNIGSPHDVKWVSAGAENTARIYYSNEGTNNFTALTPAGIGNNQVFPGQNTWVWNVSRQLIPSVNARVKVESGTYTEISPAFILRGIRITDPVATSVWDVGSSRVVSWKQAGIDPSARAELALSLDGGATYPHILDGSYGIVDFDFFLWDIDPTYDPTTNAVLRMRIVSSAVPVDVGVTATSDPFTLKGIKVLSPASGSTWQLGSTNRISFIAAGAGATATIRYSANGGATYDAVPVAAMPLVAGSNGVDWAVEVSRQPSTNARIQVQGTLQSGVSEPFTVGGVKVQRPMQYDIWAVGETNTIQWIAVGTLGTVDIELVYEDNTTYTIASGYAGASPLDWLVDAGAIPGGLTTVSNVVLRVTDAGGYQGRSEPFKMVSQPRIEMVAPAPGEYWKVGETKTIQWVKGGQMQADQFDVFFSRDGFASREQIYSAVAFDSTNNTFSMAWSIPDRLGTTQILVTNTVNSLVWALTENFYVAGNFRVIFPNGEVGEDELYALDTVNASWGTRGSVTNVDLYYRSGLTPWTRINAAPLPNIGAGTIEQFSGAPWTLPNLQSPTVQFRVQDSSYTNIYDGLTPGPYDDSDGLLEVKYYSVYWDLTYVNNFGITGRLDKLSVTDSSGWSQSGLSCLDAGGAPQPILHKYPYGTYDTAWYREFFHDAVDFHWLCNSNHTRQLTMNQAEVEPDYHVMANFAYDVSNRSFTVHSWVERSGGIMADPSENTINIYLSDGTLVETLTKTAHDQNGVFWQVWDVATTEARLRTEGVLAPGESFDSADIFFAKVDVEYSGVTYSAGLTFALRLAAAEEQVAAIEAIVANATAQILDDVNSVNTNVNALHGSLAAFRGETLAGISNILDMGVVTTGLLGDVRADVQGITNEVVPRLDFLTGQIAVLEPALTNLTGQVTNLYGQVTNMQSDLVSDLARILTRPTSVEYGSTNLFLYKTRAGYGSAVVEISVSSEGGAVLETATMSEIIAGIYQQEFVADWGTNSYVVTCRDPNAADSMVLKVVGSGSMDSVPATLGTMQAQLDQLEASVTNITALVQGIQGVDLTGVMSGMSNVEAAVRGIEGADLSGIDLTGITRIESQLGQATDGIAANTFFGRLAQLSTEIGGVSVKAGDASKKAQTAKTEAANAASGIQSLKKEIQQGDIQKTLARIEEIKAALAGARQNIGEIPKAVKLAGLYDQLAAMAASIETLAQSKGFDYLVNIGQVPEGEGDEDEGLSGDSLGALNRNMEEVRGSMKFMQKLMDEMRYEPVVEEELRGAE